MGSTLMKKSWEKAKVIKFKKSFWKSKNQVLGASPQWGMNPETVRQKFLEKTLEFEVAQRSSLDENMLNTSGESPR